MGERLGGRQKGTPNKDSIPLEQKAKEMGIDPFQILLLFASGNAEALGSSVAIDNAIRMKAASEAAKYLYPQKKAIEVSNGIGEDAFKIEIVDYRANSATTKAE